ncbi:MAG: hypothetical protein CMH41_10065, partial [Micrococcales bacterium]|nr:hypothetical protein [Micrococcales bacterium]
CALEVESVEEQAAAYLESCRKHFDPQGKNFLSLNSLDLPKEGDSPLHDPLSGPGSSASTSTVDVVAVLVCTADGVLCRLRPDGEPAVLSAVRAPLEGEAYRTWADEERARLAAATTVATAGSSRGGSKRAHIAAASADGRGRGGFGRGRGRSRGKGGKGKGPAPAVQTTVQLDTSSAIQSMQSALRQSCVSWLGGREVEDYVMRELPRLASTKPFTATRYQSAVDEFGTLKPSMPPLRQLAYSVYVLELPTDLSLSSATSNPREVVRPASQLYHERLLLPSREFGLGFLLEAATHPLPPFPEVTRLTLPTQHHISHTYLFKAPFRSLSSALSIRQHRLGTAIEAGLHAFGYADAEPIAAAARTARVATVQETKDAANAKLSDSQKLSAKGVARWVDATLEELAQSDSYSDLSDETGRHHLVLRVGRTIFALIRDRVKTVESRLLRGAAALVSVEDLVGFVAEIGDPVLWVPVTQRDLHHSHVHAVRIKHGDKLWPGASTMTDEELDTAFWSLHQREFTRDVWRARFAGDGKEQVVCWMLGTPLISARVAGDEMSRSRQHQVTLLASSRAPKETAVVVQDLPPPRKFTWAALSGSLLLRRKASACRIQKHWRRHAAAALVSLLSRDVSEGPVEGAAAPSFPETQREEPPPAARS